MVDAYNPLLSALLFTPEEAAAIAAALSVESPWDEENVHIKSVKQKLKDHHLQRHRSTCCYCRTNLAGGGHYTIDREHILPKGNDNFKPLSFEIWNISVACKRCNMEMKRNKIDFLIDPLNQVALQAGANYRFIHPNFDKWEDYLCRVMVQFNEHVLVSYVVSDEPGEKGDYTHTYFNLTQLEVQSYDEAQGIARQAIATLSQAAQEVLRLRQEYNQ